MKRIKKAPWVVLFLLLFLGNLHGQWNQANIPLDDPLYDYIELAFRQNGESLPTAVRPWTVQQAILLGQQAGLQEEEIYQRSAFLRKYEDPIYEEEGMSFHLPLQLAVDLQPNAVLWQEGESTENYPSLRRAHHRPSFIEIPLSFTMEEMIYLEMNLNFKEDANCDWDSPENISTIPLDWYDVDLSFPHNAYGSLGYGRWNLSLGRMLQDWGSGDFSNLLISDTASFHDLIRLGGHYRNFNYTYAFFSMDPRLTDEQAEQYTVNQGDNSGVDMDGNSFRYNGEKYMMFHNFEFRPFPSLRIGLTEGLIVGGPDFELSPSFFNPMMLFHNWFTNVPSQGNAIHMIELDWTFKKQKYYFQYCLDQFQSPSEKESFAYAANEPGAYGYLLGVNRLDHLEHGLLSLSLECALTMPYLYTSDSYYTSHSVNEYHSSGETYTLTWPMGFQYGNDALAFTFLGNYISEQGWDLEGQLQLVIKGEQDILSEYPFGLKATPADAEAFFPTGDVSRNINLQLKGSYPFNDHIRVELGSIFAYQENPRPFYADNAGEPYHTKIFSAEPWISLFWNL